MWSAAQAADTSLICVVGWQHASSALTGGATHIGAADARERPLPEVTGWRPPVRVPRPLDPVARPDPVTRSVPIPARAPVSGGGDRAERPGPSGRRRRLWLAVVVAFLVGAAAGAAIATVLSGGSASVPATQPAPNASQVIVPASTKSGTDELLRYHDGALSPGEPAVRLAVWTGAAAPTSATCASMLSTAPSLAPVTALAGVKICLEVTGQQPRYGLVQVSRVRPGSVTTLITFW